VARHNLPAHAIKSLQPALDVLGSLGFARRTCLKGTGILLSQLDNPESRITFQQELAFYRNALRLTGDPLIGLKLGEPYIPQRYGLFGYALLSVPTLRRALNLAVNFGQLTFSFFSFEFGENDTEAWFEMKDPPPIERDLQDLYLDRDMAAAVVDFSAIMGRTIPLRAIWLAHGGHGRRQDYRDYFRCTVHFSRYPSRLVFDPALLDETLPQGDLETSRFFREQCRMLLARLESESRLTDDVRMILLARPGEFPGIDEVAQRLYMSTRTLRRRLSDEGHSFRELLDAVRFQLACQYLEDTTLPLAEISSLVGYSEPGNFSHAFSRWSGMSPRVYRQRQLS